MNYLQIMILFSEVRPNNVLKKTVVPNACGILVKYKTVIGIVYYVNCNIS